MTHRGYGRVDRGDGRGDGGNSDDSNVDRGTSHLICV